MQRRKELSLSEWIFNLPNYCRKRLLAGYCREKRKGDDPGRKRNPETCEEENRLLKEKIESVQQELNQSYQKPFKREQKKEEGKPAKKRGAPVGHQGKGRKRPEKIDQYIDIYPNQCDCCGCQNIKVYPSSFEEHIVQDIVG